MKKKVLMSLVLLTMVAAGVVFAQSQGRYYLEVYSIDANVYSTLVRQMNNTSISREDQYITVRTDKNTKVISKDRNLTFDQLKQKFDHPILSGIDLSPAQQKWGLTCFENVSGDQSASYRYFWIRRTE